MTDNILCTGRLCADIVSSVPKFILEDSDQRCLKQSWERGGNASNNATVLARLGANVEFLGTIANDHLLTFLTEDMKANGIHYENCPILPCHQAPLSVVISSQDTGSRTIIHNNGTLPELSFEDFQNAANLNDYAWVHFEGRYPPETSKMLQMIEEYNLAHPLQLPQGSEIVPNYKKKKLPVSIEVEKKVIPLGSLLPHADVAFVGKDFAEFHGAKNHTEAAKLASSWTKKGTVVICPWGDQGASFCIADDNPTILTVQAYPPPKIVDSLGAGDTFDGAVIFALSSGLDIESSVRFGCKIAGGKLGQHGFKHVDQIAKDLPEFHEIQRIRRLARNETN